jgi:hypothetical protein
MEAVYHPRRQTVKQSLIAFARFASTDTGWTIWDSAPDA